MPRKLHPRPFEEARAFARQLGFTRTYQWVDYSFGRMPEKGMRPADIPSNPRLFYKDCGWAGMADFLGCPTIGTDGARGYSHGLGKRRRGSKFWSFKKARAYVRKLGLERVTGAKGWNGYCSSSARPLEIPSAPRRVYSREWISWPDFLNSSQTAHRHHGIWESFAAAKRFARKLGLNNKRQWRRYCRGEFAATLGVRPDHVPSNPDMVYKGCGWKSYTDFLLGPKAQPRVLPFHIARKEARKLKLETIEDYKRYVRAVYPIGTIGRLPRCPHATYKEFRGYPDFLGHDPVVANQSPAVLTSAGPTAAPGYLFPHAN